MNNEVVNYYSPNITTAQDYYPFGMTMPWRNMNSGDYRYGFQNLETDQELWDGAVSYKYRIEDPRLGRFFSVDPLAPKHPWNSTYAFSENRLIDGVELEGLEWNGRVTNNMDPLDGDGDYTRSPEELMVAGKIIKMQVYIAACAFLPPSVMIPALLSDITGAPVLPAPQAMSAPLAGMYASEAEIGLVNSEVFGSSNAETTWSGVLKLEFQNGARQGIQIGELEGQYIFDDIASATGAVNVLDDIAAANTIGRIQGESIRDIGKLANKLSQYESRLGLDELKALEKLVLKHGGNLRYDLNPVKGKFLHPHVQIENLTPTIESRHIYLGEDAIKYLQK